MGVLPKGRRTRVGTAWGVVAAAGVMAACSGSPEIRLPTATIQKFKEACATAGFVPDQCTCFVDQISAAGLSDAQFKEAEESLAAGQGLPPEFEEARSLCPPPPVNSSTPPPS